MKNEKEKEIITPQLTIAGNIMAWKDSIIQLSNICSISTVPLGLTPFPIWTLLLFLIGIYIFNVSWMIAIAIVAVVVIFILNWYQKNEKLKKQKNLIILMNSGITFSFLFNDQKFLNQVFGVLSSIIAKGDKETPHIKINITNSEISGNAKILNDLFVS